jgi:hypothetical protein
MIEVIGVPDERSCTGDGDVVIDVAVHAKDFRILGFLRTINVKLSFHHGVEIELVGFAVIVDGTRTERVKSDQQGAYYTDDELEPTSQTDGRSR